MDENLSDALYIVFAMFSFIVAFSLAIYMTNHLNATARTIVFGLDKTNYYDSVALDELIYEDNKNQAYKVVSVDSIIPTLYRYYKESFAVKILDEDGNLLQMFDANIESRVRTATALTEDRRTKQQKALVSLYGDPAKKWYMFGAPWVGSTSKDTKERIDMYIAGKAGYINNTWVDYSGRNNTTNLKQYEKRKFKEIFSEYSYEGDILYVEDRENIDTEHENDETIIGSKQVSTKIIITYQLLPQP